MSISWTLLWRLGPPKALHHEHQLDLALAVGPPKALHHEHQLDLALAVGAPEGPAS